MINCDEVVENSAAVPCGDLCAVSVLPVNHRCALFREGVVPRLAGLLILFFGLLQSALSQSATLPDVIDAVRPGIVGVGSARPVKQPGASVPAARFMGTGFAVADGTYIVTNDHVVPSGLNEDAREIVAVFVGRGKAAKTHPVEIVARDPAHDLALLRLLEGGPVPALKLGRSRLVREGQGIAFTGFPIGVVLGLHPVTHRGIVSVITPIVIPGETSRTITPAQMQRLRNPFDVFQLDATAYPGNSGSPVYDIETGVVLGVLNSVFIKETKETLLQKPSGISYAIPVEYVHDLLVRAGVTGG